MSGVAAVNEAMPDDFCAAWLMACLITQSNAVRRLPRFKANVFEWKAKIVDRSLRMDDRHELQAPQPPNLHLSSLSRETK